MKTKLLKKLRKQAHDSFRIVPHYVGKGYYIETKNDRDGWMFWHRIYNREHTEYLTIQEAIERIAELRKEEFYVIAGEAIRKRQYQEQLQSVKDL